MESHRRARRASATLSAPRRWLGGDEARAEQWSDRALSCPVATVEKEEDGDLEIF
jgi:hypothetical protein